VISDFESQVEVLINADRTRSGSFFDAGEFVRAGEELKRLSKNQRDFLLEASERNGPFSREVREELLNTYNAFSLNIHKVNELVRKCASEEKLQSDYEDYQSRM